jgi:hypothetical protein
MQVKWLTGSVPRDLGAGESHVPEAAGTGNGATATAPGPTLLRPDANVAEGKFA